MAVKKKTKRKPKGDRYDAVIDGIKDLLHKHNMELFRIDIGDMEQGARYWRKETHHQWVRRKRKEEATNT